MISLIKYYENGKKDLLISSDNVNRYGSEITVICKGIDRYKWKILCLELHLKGSIPSRFNIGQKHKTKAFLRFYKDDKHWSPFCID